MKTEIIFKLSLIGILGMYTLFMIGIVFGFFTCLDGVVFEHGFIWIARIVGAVILGFVFFVGIFLWIYLFVSIIRCSGEGRPVTDDEIAQFDEYMKQRNEKKKTKKGN